MGCLGGKQFWQGEHCTQMRSLPVSAIASLSTGGVPMYNVMRYSPFSGIRRDSGSLFSSRKCDTRFNREPERKAAFVMRSDGVSEGL